MLATGTILQNRYRIISLLGRGGMGAVYRAWHLSLSIPLAIKEMTPQPGLDVARLAQLRQQFQQEAAILARLSHPNLVRVIDHFEEGGNAYLVMDFVEGESLAERIARERALPEEEVLAWADQLLDALGYCHGQGVIHRDIKPQNVIVRPDGRVVLVDFGLVKLWDPDDPHTRTAMRGMGTPEYAPPEQYGTQPGHTDPRSDVYGLGATLYHALTGQEPMTANDRMAALSQFPSVHDLNLRVSEETSAAVSRAMELPVPSRFSSAAQMQAALGYAARASASGASVVAPSWSQPAPRRQSTKVMPGAGVAVRAQRRVPVWAWALGGVAVVALCVGLALSALGGGLSVLVPTGVPIETLAQRPTQLPTVASTVTFTELPPSTTVPTAEEKSVGAACAPNCTYADMVVGFIQTGSKGSWRVANSASFRETAEQLDITLKVYDSQNDLARQIAGFHQFNRDPEVNVIILTALEEAGWEEVLQEARAAGKVVVLQDRRIDVSEDLYATYVGPDFAEEGHKSADEMCKLLEGSGKKNVWELVGNVSTSAATDRGQGFREKMGGCGIEITRSQTANWSAPEGKQVTEAWLRESRDVQGVFAQNDEMGLGAIEALKEAGLRPGVDVKIVSVDATAGAFTAMLAGELNATVECNPLLAPQAYAAALKALNGKDLLKWVPSQEGAFSADMPNLQEIADGRKY